MEQKDLVYLSLLRIKGEVSTPQYHPGNKVAIIYNLSHHRFELGREVTLLARSPAFGPKSWKAVDSDDNSFYIGQEEMVK